MHAITSIRKSSLPVWTAPIALLALCFISFGILLPWLGFYQDDWVLVWFARFFGPRVFIDFFAHERPFLAGIYIITTTLVGYSPLAWQIFAILARWLAALAAWWTLRTMWPGFTRAITWICMLFVVYPGFKQGFVSVVYSQDFIILAAYIASIGTMLWAVKQPGWRVPLTLLTMLLSAFSMLSSEYFFGMELLRPVFLWFYLGNNQPGRESLLQRGRKVLTYWLPYLAIMVAFVYWRLFIFKYVTYEPKLAIHLSNNPLLALFHLAQVMIEDSFNVSVFAWQQTLDIARATTSGFGSVALRWALVFISAAIVIVYLLRFQGDEPAEERPEDQPEQKLTQAGWCRQALAICLFSLFAGGWPFWFTGLSIDLEMPYDRFTMAFMFGVSILAVGLIEWLVRTRTQKVIILGVMIGLAVAMHVKVANSFRQVRDSQSDFFHQMVWRMPDIKAGTVLVTNTFPYDSSGAMSLSAAMNWIYAPHVHYPDLSYRILFIPDHLGAELPGLTKGLPIEHAFRSLTFKGSTSQAIVAYFAPPRCLLVLDPAVDGSLPKLPPQINRGMAISSLEYIQPDNQETALRMENLFGKAQPDWCYYFERADLARQKGEWTQVVKLGNQAFQSASPPEGDGVLELLPFIEGYGRAGIWEKAYRLTHQVHTTLPLTRTTLCEVWGRIKQNSPTGPEKDKILGTISKELECDLP